MPKGTQTRSQKSTVSAPKAVTQTKKSRSSSAKPPSKAQKTDNKVDESKYTKFNKDILVQHELFSKYIRVDEDNERRFICQACQDHQNPDYSSYYDFLAVHFASKAHDKALKPEERPQITEAIEAFATFRKRKRVMKVDESTLNKLSIEVTGFLLKHELPFVLAQEIVDFFKILLKEYGSNAIAMLELSNVKATQIAKNCISKSYKESIFKDLETTPFSISFDESSDLYGPSYLATHVRYLKDYKIANRLLSLEEIGEDATGESLHKIVMNNIFSGEKRKFLENNLVGACSDRGPNMLSNKDKGLLNRLENEFPIITVGDFSHSFNLVTKYSLRKFPPFLIPFIKKMGKHFSKSSLRRSQLRIIQENMEDKMIHQPLRILKYVETRWTSLRRAAERILLVWESLEIYFYENKKQHEDLYSCMNEETRLYLELLVSILQRLQGLIQYFEEDHRDYSLILPKLREAFTIWGSMIINASHIDRTNNMTKFNSLLSLETSDLKKFIKSDKEFRAIFQEENPVITKYLSRMTTTYQDSFFNVAKDFLTEVFIQTAQRIPFQHEILNLAEATKLDRLNKEGWILLAEKFKNIVGSASLPQLHMELKRLEYNFDELDKQYGDRNNLIQFYKSLSRDFPILGRLALAVQSLPYSTSSVERTFSMLKDIKEPRRNRMAVETVEACLMAHEELKRSERLCITPEMLELYSHIWKKKAKNQESPQVKEPESLEIEMSKTSSIHIEEEKCNLDRQSPLDNETFKEEQQKIEYVNKKGKTRTAKSPLSQTSLKKAKQSPE